MSTQKTDQQLSASQMVAQARTTITEITIAQAREELDQGQASLLLDVREPAEWEMGHLPGPSDQWGRDH
jgi:rhodanese-related sulfurtransferase